MVEAFEKYRNIFAEMIRQGIKEGSLSAIEPASGAHAVLSLASGLFLQSLLYPEGEDWAKVAEDSLELLLKGLRRR